jgi:hypothetical protein
LGQLAANHQSGKAQSGLSRQSEKIMVGRNNLDVKVEH